MTWHSHTVVLYLWCAQPILQSVVAVILWRRKLHKQFPVFFLFLLVQVANFAIIFPLWFADNYTLYFGLFWLGEAVNAVLGFKVIHEIFLDVFRPYHTLKDLGTLLFKWAGVVMLLVSVVVAFSNSFDQSPLVHAVTTLQRSVRIVQVGLILFLVLFSQLSGSVAEADQFWDLSRLWTLRRRGIDADGDEFGGIRQAGQPQPDQHVRLTTSPFLFGSATRSRARPCAWAPSTTCRPSDGNKAWPIFNPRCLPIR